MFFFLNRISQIRSYGVLEPDTLEINVIKVVKKNKTSATVL